MTNQNAVYPPRANNELKLFISNATLNAKKLEHVNALLKESLTNNDKPKAFELAVEYKQLQAVHDSNMFLFNLITMRLEGKKP